MGYLDQGGSPGHWGCNVEMTVSEFQDDGLGGFERLRGFGFAAWAPDSGFRAFAVTDPSHRKPQAQNPCTSCRPATQLWSPHRHRRSGQGSQNSKASYKATSEKYQALSRPSHRSPQPRFRPKLRGLRRRSEFRPYVPQNQRRQPQPRESSVP